MVNIGSLETEVTVDVDKVLTPPNVRCDWHREIVDFQSGDWRWVIRALDLAKEGRATERKHQAYKVRIVGNRLVCNCPSFYWDRAKDSTCKHVQAAAVWLEAQESSIVGDKGKIAFCLGCHNDPHRLAARYERQQAAEAAIKQRTGRPATLEQLFDVE